MCYVALVRLGAWCDRWAIIGLLCASEFCERDACVQFHFFPLLHIEVGQVPDELPDLACSCGLLGWCYG